MFVIQINSKYLFNSNFNRFSIYLNSILPLKDVIVHLKYEDENDSNLHLKNIELCYIVFFNFSLRIFLQCMTLIDIFVKSLFYFISSYFQ